MIKTSALLAGLVATTAALFAPTAAFAGEEQGVTCPAGSIAEISNGSRNLVCYKNTPPIERESTCLSRFSVNHVIVQNGPDFCSDLKTQVRGAAPTPALLPGDPQTNWTRGEFPTGKDKFTHAGGREYVLPEGTFFNPAANKQRGVACEAPFSDGDTVANGRGIRCEKPQRVAADCDFGWTLRVDDLNGNTDKCIGINGAGPTKPRGISKVQYDGQKNKWILDVNNGPDTWREFAFPKTR